MSKRNYGLSQLKFYFCNDTTVLTKVISKMPDHSKTVKNTSKGATSTTADNIQCKQANGLVQCICECICNVSNNPLLHWKTVIQSRDKMLFSFNSMLSGLSRVLGTFHSSPLYWGGS